MAKWSLDLSKYAEKVKQDMNTVRRKVAFQCFTSVVEKTPVDTGRARGNWTISVGSEDTKVLDRTDKQTFGSSSGYSSTESEKLENVSGDETIYIQNNLPYIKKLEYGGYPSPVKRGTWNAKEHKYEIRSKGGYSKQAPSGMVGLTMAELDNFVKKAVEETK